MPDCVQDDPREAEAEAALANRLLAVVIPAYNEERTVAKVIEQVDALPCVREILVVDDASTDRTATIVEAFNSPRVRLLRQPRNQGKTAAVARGLAEVSSPICIIQDADLEYDPSEIPQVIGPIINGKADVVYGSRFLVSRASRVLYFYHYLANRMLTFFSNLLTNVNMTDIETCYKAFRTPILQQLPLTSKGFGMEVEITAMVCHTKARIYEAPISYYGRTYEEGKKIGFRDAVQAVWYIFYYNVLHRRRRIGRRYIESVNRWLAEQRAAAEAAQARL
ncbi:MAG: glycosyltransferase family 2 protein [Thermoguttaceae bacterium]